MTIAVFSINEVKTLVDELERSTRFSPTIEDLFRPELYEGGKVIDSNGVIEGQKEFGWPDSKKIERSKVEPQLILVKDRGLYLLNNADVEGTPIERGSIAYAHGCDPEKDEYYYDNSLNIFGGDDGTVSIPVHWFELALQDNKRLFKVQVTPEKISYVFD